MYGSSGAGVRAADEGAFASEEALTITRHVATLRAALRAPLEANGTRGVDDGMGALPPFWIDTINRTLLAYGNRLARNAGLRGVEGGDLVQDAWLKVMSYLAGPNGDRVQDDAHLLRLLRVALKSRLLDLLEKPGERSSTVIGRGVNIEGGMAAGMPDLLRESASEGRYQRLIEALFAGEEAFREVCRHPPRRRARQYRAFVLCLAGAFLRNETCGGGEHNPVVATVALVRAYMLSVGVPLKIWAPVEAASLAEPSVESVGQSEEDASDEAILEVVNRVCGTNLRNRATLAVLRYEFNQLV